MIVAIDMDGRRFLWSHDKRHLLNFFEKIMEATSPEGVRGMVRLDLLPGAIRELPDPITSKEDLIDWHCVDYEITFSGNEWKITYSRPSGEAKQENRKKQ